MRSSLPMLKGRTWPDQSCDVIAVRILGFQRTSQYQTDFKRKWRSFPNHKIVPLLNYNSPIHIFLEIISYFLLFDMSKGFSCLSLHASMVDNKLRQKKNMFEEPGKNLLSLFSSFTFTPPDVTFFGAIAPPSKPNSFRLHQARKQVDVYVYFLHCRTNRQAAEV